jgi:NAD(P)H dehydrogenase (quinone)
MIWCRRRNRSQGRFGVVNAEGRPVDAVVIGAAGQTGRPIVRALSARGATVRAVVHRSGGGLDRDGAADVQPAELGKVASLVAALQKAGVVYYIPPAFSRNERRFGQNVIAAAVAAQVPRLVYHSVLHAATPAMPHHRHKAQVESALRDAPIEWTVLQPCMYAQTPLAFLDRVHLRLTLGFDPHRAFTPIDVEDLADVVAAVVLDSGHEYATYELCGAERIDFIDIAAAMSQAIGDQVSIRSMPAAVVAVAAATRFGPTAIRPVKAMLRHYNRHGLVGNPNVCRLLLGREPRQYADVMQRELAAQS